MKRIKFPIYSIVSFSFVAIFFVIGLIANRIVDNGTFFYTGLNNFTIDDFRVFALLIFISLLISAIIVFLFKNIRKKYLNIIITVIIVTVSLFCFLYTMFCVYVWSPNSYVELVSDDGEHHIVIAEDCYPFSIYGGIIYEKTSAHTMKRISRYSTSIDIYTPFSNGSYSVIWYEENFELFYDSNGDGEKDEKILVKYLNW